MDLIGDSTSSPLGAIDLSYSEEDDEIDDAFF